MAEGTTRYALERTGLELRELSLVRLVRNEDKTQSVIADYDLGDLTELRLHIGRRSGDWVAVLLAFAVASLDAFAILRWAVPSNGAGAWIVCGVGALLAVLALAGAFSSRTAWLVVHGSSHGTVEIPITEDVDLARSFFGEIREHAHRAKLRVSFREVS